MDSKMMVSNVMESKLMVVRQALVDGFEQDGFEGRMPDGFELDGFEVGVLDGFEGDGFEPDNDYLSQIESIIS